MQVKDDENRDALLAELELHKTEFSELRAEILQWLDAERQHLNLSLVAIAAGLGFAPFVSGQKAFALLLLFPLVFHVLLAEMLNAASAVNSLSGYLLDTLIPRVNAILDALGDERQGVTVLGWEVHLATRPLRKSDLLLASLTPTQHWVPILAIAALLVSYGFLIGSSQGYVPSLAELALIPINLLLLIFAALRNTVAAQSTMQRSRRLQEIKTR